MVNHRHRDRFQVLRPIGASVESVFEVIALLEGRKAPQPHQDIRILQVDERAQNLDAVTFLQRPRAVLEEAYEVVTLTWFYVVRTDLYDRGVCHGYERTDQLGAGKEGTSR